DAMRRARDAIPDAELVLRVGARSDGDPPHGLRRLIVSQDERVALVLVRDLIEGPDEANARFDRQDFAAEADRLRLLHATHAAIRPSLPLPHARRHPATSSSSSPLD